MPAIKYVIDLRDDERKQWIEITRRGSSPARKLKRAMILLRADEGFGDGEIARMVDVGIATVGRIRKRFVEAGLEGTPPLWATRRDRRQAASIYHRPGLQPTTRRTCLLEHAFAS